MSHELLGDDKKKYESVLFWEKKYICSDNAKYNVCIIN